MQRRLILLRHAKSSWKKPVPDHDRTLNGRGKKDAPRVGAHLRALGWTPDVVLSSDAARATQTFARMKKPLGFAGEPRLLPDLYHGDLATVGEALAGLDDGARTVLLVGHNPEWEEVLGALTGAEETMPTCAAALLERELARWSDAVAPLGAWRLVGLVRPKAL